MSAKSDKAIRRQMRKAAVHVAHTEQQIAVRQLRELFNAPLSIRIKFALRVIFRR